MDVVISARKEGGGIYKVIENLRRRLEEIKVLIRS